ncbi:hypothetical protein ACHHYP_00239 [Achlya hypogyna]|uniref:Uncharacterized protein n=1 Tax=Achlya hypogyna TaxID=1202772 RepID=A0A1V9ZAZ2_ACHHY|nr:hypothetical protein ACHHYP_00239 [Achlya hypogyna]
MPSVRVQVAPHASGLVAAPAPVAPRDYPSAVGGLMYVLLSLTGSIWYTLLLQPSFANDLWWGGYNVSGHQAFLIDLVNQFLATNASGTLDLLAPTSAVLKSYASFKSTSTISPTYMRSILLGQLTTVEYAVPHLRQLSTYWCMRMNIQHCWVDFNQSFEVAHTVVRQQRCVANYRQNAAVYMEAILRNQPWVPYLALWGGAGLRFNVAIQRGLEETQRGRNFLAHMATAFTDTTVSDELAYWASFNLTTFQLQWQDRWQPGVSETIVIENALGMQQPLTLKSLNQVTGPWSSQNLFWIPLNDLYNGMTMNRSFVRGTSRYFGTNQSGLGIVDLEAWSGVVLANTTAVFHTTVGPYLSVDCWFKHPPSDLIKYVTEFTNAALVQILASTTLSEAYSAIQPAVVAPVPPLWTSFTFHGGDLSCTTSSATTFVQDQFSFFNDCTHSTAFKVRISELKALWALLARQTLAKSAPMSPCSLQASDDCISTWAAAGQLFVELTFAPHLTGSFEELRTQIQALDIAVMQYGEGSGQPLALLQQPLLTGADASWDAFGWILLFDWATGVREVVSFEGDAATVVLISSEYAGQASTTTSISIQTATKGIYFLVVCTTAIIIGVGGITTVYAVLTRLRFNGRNLWRFNRVVGGVWLGRPLMALRGISALVLMSSSQMTLTTNSVTGYSALTLASWSLFDAAILTGEATWLTYALNELLLVWFPATTTSYGPLTSLTLWLIYFCIHVAAPVTPSVTIDRQCIGHDMDYGVVCSGGIIRIGSASRLWLLLALHCGVLATGLAGAALYARWTSKIAAWTHMSILLSGAAAAFLTPTSVHEGTHALDKVACGLAGILPFRFRGLGYVFLLRSWVVMADTTTPGRDAVELEGPCLGPVPPPPRRNTVTLATSPVAQLVGKVSTWTRLVRATALVYMLSSIGGSVSYFAVAEVNLANDLFWPNFNVTGAHTFFATWLNEQLVLGLNDTAITLNSPSISLLGPFAATPATITAVNNYGAWLQHNELNTVEAAIAGLRVSDACVAPWIFTQYCYLDFKQAWPMAYSARRQMRCQSMVANGAVFLEAVLRNVDWGDWIACWGDAFAVAFGNEIQTTSLGRAWLHEVATTRLPLADEATYWRAQGIQSFDMQWQNYKRIGATNRYSITNAIGFAYPMQLLAIDSAFRIDQETSFKMYWSLANDLATVGSNTSRIGGASLLRNSAHFAFANCSLQSVMVANGTLSSPLDNGLVLVASAIGPFGVTDMVYVGVPPLVSSVVRTLLALTRSALVDAGAQAAFAAIAPLGASYPIPKAWGGPNYLAFGSNPLCPAMAVGKGIYRGGLINLLTYDYPCSTTMPINSRVIPSRQHYITSAVLSGIVATPATLDYSSLCSYDPAYLTKCLDYLNKTVDFVALYMMSAVDMAAAAAAHSAALDLGIEFMLYTERNGSLALLHTKVLDPADPGFHYFGWTYLYDWVLGFREVVAFQGDSGTLTLITDLEPALAQQVDAGQMTQDFARYCRAAVWYVTCVMIVVAAVALGYTLQSRGQLQGLNLFELCRVGGIVWVGRPLLLLRSLTALCVLSTGSLELVFSGNLSRFAVVPTPWYKVCLASGEVTWLAAVVTDVLLVATQEYAGYYVTLNSVCVWLTVALLAVLDPVQAQISVRRSCVIAMLDEAVVCNTGAIAIGSSARLVQLVVIVVGWNLVSFLAARHFVGDKPEAGVHSHLLSANAKYLFYHANRTRGGVYYLDRASAALDGILTYRRGRVMHALDIKLWRVFAAPLPSLAAVGGVEKELSVALPLTN